MGGPWWGSIAPDLLVSGASDIPKRASSTSVKTVTTWNVETPPSPSGSPFKVDRTTSMALKIRPFRTSADMHMEISPFKFADISGSRFDCCFGLHASVRIRWMIFGNAVIQSILIYLYPHTIIRKQPKKLQYPKPNQKPERQKRKNHQVAGDNGRAKWRATRSS